MSFINHSPSSPNSSKRSTIDRKAVTALSYHIVYGNRMPHYDQSTPSLVSFRFYSSFNYNVYKYCWFFVINETQTCKL